METESRPENNENSKISDNPIAASTERLGKIAETRDNGFYTGGNVYNLAVKFLIDSGSTSSLLSYRCYKNINSPIELQPVIPTLHDVNGNKLRVYGRADIPIDIQNKQFIHNVIICDMTPDGILGQDFLLQNIKSVNYETYEMITNSGNIQCWVGGGSSMVCRITVRENIALPGNSTSWVPVEIPYRKHTEHSIHVQPLPRQCNQVHLVEGIVSPDESSSIAVINYGEEPITLYQNTKIGLCESINAPTDYPRCAHISNDNSKTAVPESETIPDYLTDLFERSSGNLEQEDNTN